MLRLKIRDVVVPDEYRFTCPHDGVVIWRNNLQGWFDAIRAHYKDNDHPLPDDWQAQAEDQLCRLLPPGWCQYEDGSDPQTFINRRFTLDDAVRGTKVLIEFVKQGAPLVSQEEAERRGKICAACYAALPIPGCSSCSRFANFVAEVAGARTTKSDQFLDSKSCGVCGCSAIANVWVPVEVSKAAVTEEMMQQWPSHCWKAEAIRALRDRESQSK